MVLLSDACEYMGGGGRGGGGAHLRYLHEGRCMHIMTRGDATAPCNRLPHN